MDVTRRTFPSQLPAIISAIADAHFVAIDLELSGIPTSQANKLRAYDGGRPSLQERYEENKKAAEKYQILQLGITCVGENLNRGVYVVRPYNFFLNPVPDERLNVERVFSYHSGAADFLLKRNFRMEAPYLEGVHYFSRVEEAIARQIAAQRQDRASIADIQPRTDDAESIELLRRLEEEVVAWKNRTHPKPDFLNFTAGGVGNYSRSERTLNSYQKRLIHQFIRTNYPDLVTEGRNGFVQIVAYDREREISEQRYRTAKFQEILGKQIGLRWLVEAICGGDVSALDIDNIYPTVKIPMAAEFVSLRERLSGQSTVLVGHNVFLDLIYFYACFFGPLPDKVEDFQRVIHGLFPRIIDTKYLATHDIDNPAFGRSSLEELSDRLSKQPQPVIELHPLHPKYELEKFAHEAGFDSYLTAQILIRLSTTLDSSGFPLDKTEDGLLDSDESYFTPPEGCSPEEGCGGPLLDIDALPAQVLKAEDHSRHSHVQPNNVSAPTRSAFSHATTFDLLGDIPLEEEDLITLTLQPEKTKRPMSRKQEKRMRKAANEFGRRMPAWESHFWTVYGNKLCVNGTTEGVCDVGKWPC
ncbi:MAG: hypothetical protein L6R41_008241 [Letrouitia leprolyta]|nr:MAG: hypothetical protein L6R41_008241 [Letrouitia leprolyta]